MFNLKPVKIIRYRVKNGLFFTKVFHMSRLSVLFCALFVFLLLAGCQQKIKRAKQYHDDILQSIQTVIDSSLNYGDAIESYDKTRALKATEKYSDLVNSTIVKVEKSGDFDSDTLLQHYSFELLGFYKSSLEKQFKPVLNGIKSDSFSMEEREVVDSLYKGFAMKENQYWDRFNWAEKKFSKKYELEKLEK